MFNHRYSITSSIATSKTTGNEGCVICGWSLGLPEQAHELILTSSPEKLKKDKKFFLPYERNLPEDKLLADLRFAKEIKVFPIYFGSLPSSERVSVVSSISIYLPEFPIDVLMKEVRNINQNIIHLHSANKENIITMLNTLKYSCEDLNKMNNGMKSLKVKIFGLEFPSGIITDFYFAFVIIDFDKITSDQKSRISANTE